MMQHVLITGASSGIGLALAKQFLARGDQVTGIARDFSETNCAQMNAVTLDLSDTNKLPSELKRSVALNQSFDVLILNAGIGRFGGIEQFSYQQIEQLINTNLLSNLFLLKYYLPRFKQQQTKDIVLIGSESALNGAKQGAVYCASKFAMRGLAQSLRADCANADIRVMLVNPGPTETGFFEELHFAPHAGEEFALAPSSVALAVINALALPRNSVMEELNLQPIKRSFQKK